MTILLGKLDNWWESFKNALLWPSFPVSFSSLQERNKEQNRPIVDNLKIPVIQGLKSASKEDSLFRLKQFQTKPFEKPQLLYRILPNNFYFQKKSVSIWVELVWLISERNFCAVLLFEIFKNGWNAWVFFKILKISSLEMKFLKLKQQRFLIGLCCNFFSRKFLTHFFSFSFTKPSISDQLCLRCIAHESTECWLGINESKKELHTKRDKSQNSWN